MNVYEIVTEKILEQLRKGVVPWHKPWKDGFAQNWETRRPYTGINAFLLPKGEYATFNQITKAGGRIKKGEKAWIVVFWKMLDKKNEEGEVEDKIPLLRYYHVWEINSQCEGLESRFVVKHHHPIEEAEAIVRGYQNSPLLKLAGDAWYNSKTDTIGIPPIDRFEDPESYYCTLFHEMTHSTGHPSRLRRFGIEVASFKGEDYSKEELVAEMGSALLAGLCGIDTEKTFNNSASYIHAWLNTLKRDSKLVVCAASKAQAAVNFIRGGKDDVAQENE